MNVAAILIAAGSSIRRPRPIPHAPLPPFDQSDSGGDVHTTPPPEWQPPAGPDPLFMRGDFNGVTLDANRWGGHQKFVDAFLIGANTTPYEMIMTPMLIMYPRWLQDACLTEHAERGYTHFTITPDGWNFDANGFTMTADKLVAWARYVRSWGFYVVYWRSVPVEGDLILGALVDAHVIDLAVPGEEVDGKISAPGFGAVLDDTLHISGHGIPVLAHFTANYPEGFPRDTFFDGRSMKSFADYNGLVHLAWQADQNESAGTQAARCYYARQRVNLGAVGGDGREAPDSRVFAYETMASKQLVGQCTEEYGCLRSLELNFATRLNTQNAIRPMAGSNNGLRYPDGRCV